MPFKRVIWWGKLLYTYISESLPDEPVGLSIESSTYGRGSSPDEHTFDRKGPLTIPVSSVVIILLHF